MSTKKLHLVSLGCTKNLIDSEVMLGKLKEYEITDDSTQADLIIVNTCGFIESAKQESLNTIFELDGTRKEESVLVMAGCLSERYQDELKEGLENEVDIFTGVGDYDVIDKLVEEKRNQFSQKVFLADESNDRVVTGSSYHAYIKLSEGCNQVCSFCAIPAFKGKLHSRTLESLVKEVTNLVKNGYTDFSFVSQDSSSYLRDLDIKNGLERLVEDVEKIEGIKTARILYLYPSTTSLDYIQRVADSKKFHNYFDIPIQHISDKMLKVMRRGAGKEKTLELLRAMRELPNSFVRTSFIIGHPEESESDFNEIVEFIREFCFDMINIFAYSDEEDTHSFDLESKVPDEVINDRVSILEEIIEEQRVENLQKYIGREIIAVIDGESSEHEFLLSAKAIEWTPEIDGEIYINDKEIEQIEFSKPYRVKITDLVGDKLIGTILNRYKF